MRIIHVTRSSETSMLGVEVHVLNLAAAQKKRGSGVLVITDCPGVFARACRQHDVPVLVLQDLSPDSMPRGLPPEKTIQRLIVEFKNFGAELIHCHTLPSARPVLFAGNQLGIPCIVTLHVNAPIGALTTAKKSGMNFTCITVSKRYFEDLRKEMLWENDVHYIPNGSKATSVVDPQEGCSSRSPNLIFVGTLDRNKGADLAILALEILRRRRGETCPVLNVYGADGGEEEYLKEMVIALNLDGFVKFHGVRNGILEHCPSTDVLVMSSRSETGPLVVLEAMSRGMPIVASDVGEVAEMLPDQRYGRVVPANSIIDLAGSIDSILSDIADGQFDPALVVNRHQSYYTVEKMAEQVETVYRQVLARESPHQGMKG